MGLLKRLFGIGEAKANAAVDKLENPTEMTKQALRDLKAALQEGINAQAEVKASAMQHRATEAQHREKAAEMEQKANTLLDRIEAGQLDETRGNEAVNAALKSQQDSLAQAATFEKLALREEAAEKKMGERVKMISEKIHETENDVKIIESREKVATATEKVNKALSTTDVDGVMETINRMKEKVSASEFKADAYAEVDNANISAETNIDNLLKETSPNAALEALKAKRAAAKAATK